jgi:hypothetical protein
MTRPRFRKSFTQQLPIPEDGIQAALAVMRSGRLHRYNTLPGQPSGLGHGFLRQRRALLFRRNGG